MLSCSFMNHEHVPVCEHAARAFLAPLDRLHGLQDSTRFELAEDAWYDAIVEIRSATGADRYAAEAVTGVTTTTLRAVRSRLGRVRARTGLPPLLLTDYVTPAVAERLIDHGTVFVDGAGNVHLDGTAAYVVILGRPRSQKPRHSGFTPIGLELIFALLAEPRLLGAPVREASERTGISTGKVSALLNALVDQGYLGRRNAAGRRRLLVLQEQERLLQRWELGYLEVLRPRLSPSSSRLPPSVTFDRVAQMARDDAGTLIGGEHAADALTGFLKPASLTLRVPPGTQKRTAMRLGLAPAKGEPEVTLNDRFQARVDAYADGPAPSVGRHSQHAHPILVRAELLAGGSDRLREVPDRLLGPILNRLAADAA